MNPEGSSFSLASAMNSLYGLRQTSQPPTFSVGRIISTSQACCKNDDKAVCVTFFETLQCYINAKRYYIKENS